MQPPTLIVHGIWDSEKRVLPLTAGLRRRGLPDVHAFSLRPNNGSLPIARLAMQVQGEVEALCESRAVGEVDLVGFSMGALAARYYLQRLDGCARVRRFISISGPHHGTWAAYALPLAGLRDMRPQSPLMRDLGSDPDPFGTVEVHCIYTPFDLVIVPPHSSVLPQARSTHRIGVPIHRLMIRDARVLDLTARLLLSAN